MNDLQGLIQKVAQETGVDSRVLAALVHQESRGNPNARSPAGALGLAQLMPDTARSLGVANPMDPEQNLRGGAKYLKQQLDRFGDLKLALAAYNAGPGNVIKHKGVPPFKETQNYVASIMNNLGGEPTFQAPIQSTEPQRKTQTIAQNEPDNSAEFFDNLVSFLGGDQPDKNEDFDNLLKIILG